MATAPGTEERLARLEAGYEHLATKADLAQMETRLIKWIVGAVLASAAIAVAVATLIERLT